MSVKSETGSGHASLPRFTTSWVWHHFCLPKGSTARDAAIVTCKHCSKQVKRGIQGVSRMGTTQLARHLRGHHYQLVAKHHPHRVSCQDITTTARSSGEADVSSATSAPGPGHTAPAAHPVQQAAASATDAVRDTNLTHIDLPQLSLAQRLFQHAGLFCLLCGRVLSIGECLDEARRVVLLEHFRSSHRQQLQLMRDTKQSEEERQQQQEN